MPEFSEIPQPTARDAMLFQVILTSMKNKPEVDWAVVAARAGYKNAGCANSRYNQIIKRLTGMTAGQIHALAGSSTADGGASTASPFPVKKRGGAGSGSGSGTNKLAAKVEKGTPKKRGRKPKAKNEEIKVFEDEDEGELEKMEGDDGDMKEVFVVEDPVQEYENAEEEEEN